MNKGHVLVGSCLSCLERCLKESKSLVLTNFKNTTPEKLLKKTKVINGYSFQKTSEYWYYLKFVCSMRGLIINNLQPSSVRILDNQLVVSYSNKKTKINFEKCYFYPDEVIKCDLEIKESKDHDIYKVLDFMKIKVGTHLGLLEKKVGLHHVDSVLLDDSKVIGVSYLGYEQLKDPNYSDTISRFICEKFIENEVDVLLPYVDKEKRFQRKLKLEVIDRVVYPCAKLSYRSTDRVVCCDE